MKINILDIEKKLNSDSPVDELLAYYIILAKHKNIVNRPRINELIRRLMINQEEDAEDYSSALFAYLDIDNCNINNILKVDIFDLMSLQDLLFASICDLAGVEATLELLKLVTSRIYKSFAPDSLEYGVVALKAACQYSIIGDQEGYYDAIFRVNFDVLKDFHELNIYYFANAYFILGDGVAQPRAVEFNQYALELVPKVLDGDVTDVIICTYNLAASYYNQSNIDMGELYINQVFSYQDEYIDVCPEIFFMAYILMIESSLSQYKDNMDAVEELFSRAESCLGHLENPEEIENGMGTLLLSKSKVYCDIQDYKACERCSRQAYDIFKKVGNEYNLLLVLNNLTLSLYYQGMTIECGKYLSEGMKLVENCEAQGLQIADYIYNTWAVLSAKKPDYKLDSNIRSWLDNCYSVNMGNFQFVYTSLQYVVQEKLDGKTCKQIERVLSLMEEYVEIADNYIMTCNFFLAKAMYLYRVKSMSEVGEILVRMIDFEEQYDPACNISYEAVCIRWEMFKKALPKVELKEILLRLVRQTPYRLQSLLELSDETALLRKLAFYGKLYKIIVAYACSGTISCSDEELFELVVNSKNLYSELLYARKQIEVSSACKQEYAKVKSLRRSIMDIEVGTHFGHTNNRDDINKLKEDRHKLEINILENVDRNIFEWLSYEEILEKLPEGVMYIDYLQYPSVVRDENFLMDLKYLTMAVVKCQGRVFLKRLPSVSLLSVRRVFVNMEDYVRRRSRKDEKTILDVLFDSEKHIFIKLYSMLIKPAFDELRTVFGPSFTPGKLLISGDAELSSFPFDLLMTENGEYLLDRCRVSYVNSLKDYQGETCLTEDECQDALIVGNPQFSIDKSLDFNNKNPHYLQPIPLSKVEAQAVAEALQVQAITRKTANKGLFDNVNHSILHIATHGNHYDLEVESDDDGIFEDYVFPLKNSCLFLSGANDYIATGQISPEYGTGVMTAEELCTYDLSSLKLVVMSACFSGSGDISYSQGLLGMGTAIMSQGINNLITNLWEVDDFASAVFMTRFYESIKSMSVVDALYDAKHYLKNVTIGQLSDYGWFVESRIRRIGLVAEDMRKISAMPKNYKIFSKPFFWAGFVLLER